MKTTSLSIDPVTDRRFEVVRPLGEGASGAVFLALDRETGEHVALKKLFKLDQKSVLRFKREFRALADIHHPNLVKLYDLHRGHEAWFITMEYVAGKDFRQKFSTEATLSRETMQPANDAAAPAGLLTAFYDLARGVNAIHRAGMLHRDLKPTNALVGDNGRVVVLDFGLVREIDGDSQLTQEGAIAGTPAYMPPEQALGEKLGEASDWYAFGVMLYEAISGVLPINGGSVTTLLQRKLNEDPRPLRSGAPSEVLDLCMGLVARDPDARPSGAKVLEVLAAASGSMHEPETVQEQLTIEPGAPSVAQLLFGRDAELEQLRAASADPQQDNSLVLLNGELEPYLLWMKLAAAEANCRRGHEAAKAYSSAAEHAPAAQRGELLQLAAAHLVRSGRFEEGERMVQQVLATQKLHVPKTSAGLIAALAWEYGRLALRSYDVPIQRTERTHGALADVAILYGTLSAETQL